ncbi:unnamed protein product [Symbiodinium microadriaticum]|nr:unnamed protein product [Symbiodinium microadriaticum]
MYRTLLADTKFWRGLGRHNKGGIVASDDSSTITLPELTMRVASSDFQCMLGDVGDLFIDFAFIQIGNLVGSGSSASVYRGSLRQTDVAVKVSTPPEVTAEELLKIRQEALLNSKLRHPCIVSFYGICIRPPQIGIVIEYCDHGNLRESLEKDIAEWTPLRRLDAALDACRAVAYLHSQGYMHRSVCRVFWLLMVVIVSALHLYRDIKPENYFVTRSWKVKLGDFGESTTIKEEAQVSDSGGRMTVLGTIAYMAPELVEGKAFYSEAIDIYALAITIWQIWTGNDPFDGVDTFSLYDMIMRGKRPPLPTGAPPGFAEIISDGWDPSAYHRTSAQGMADSLSVVVDDYRADHTRNRTASESSRSTAASESLQVLGSSSVIDDENLLSLPYSESKRPSLLRLSSALYEDGTISPVHSGRHNFRMSTGFGSDTDYDCLDNGTGSAQQSCDMNLDLDLTGYTDDELYQGYGRKSAIDIKKSNPLIPQLKGIMTIVSPKKTKAKNKVIW